MVPNNDRLQDDLEEVYAKSFEELFKLIKRALAEVDLRNLEISQEEKSPSAEDFSINDFTVESSEAFSIDDFTIESSEPFSINDFTIESSDSVLQIKEAESNPALDERQRVNREGDYIQAELLEPLTKKKEIDKGDDEIPVKKVKEFDEAENISKPDNKVLFGQSTDGFVNHLSPKQEAAIGQMFMDKPGSKIPDGENLTIKYKGKIIASTNAEGILEANELYGKISPQTLQKLSEAVSKTAYTNAPERGDKASTLPVAENPIKESDVVKSAPVSENNPIAVPIGIKPIDIKPMAEVPSELRIPSPVKRTPVPSGDTVVQIQAALAAVAVTGNGIAALAVESAIAIPVIAEKTLVIDPKNITGIDRRSNGKVAGIIDWIDKNEKEGLILSPNNFTGTVSIDPNNDERTYTLKDPKGATVLEGTTTKSGSAIEIETFDNKKIGQEWNSIKKSMKETEAPVMPIPSIAVAAVEAPVMPIPSIAVAAVEAPVMPIPSIAVAAVEAQSTGVNNETTLTNEQQLRAIKYTIDRYTVKEGVDASQNSTQKYPNLTLRYDGANDYYETYTLKDSKDPSSEILFSVDREGDDISLITKSSVTPDMLSFIETANTHMIKENNLAKDALQKVNVAEDLEPGMQSVNSTVIPAAPLISVSNIPIPTVQSQEVTAKMDDRQFNMIARSIAIVDIACEVNDAKSAELLHTSVSVEEHAKNSKLYTVSDKNSDEQLKFTSDSNTGKIEIITDSPKVGALLIEEEKGMSGVFPNYPKYLEITQKEVKEGNDLGMSKDREKQIETIPVSKSKAKSKGGR
jgi:hypothetical protein